MGALRLLGAGAPPDHGTPVRPAPRRRPYGAGVSELLRPARWLQRRRFGAVRPPRLVGVAVICVYTMSLAGLTIAPAYDVAVTCRSRSGGVARWDPFHSAAEVLAMQRGGAGLFELA